jgi:hypothetical protein
MKDILMVSDQGSAPVFMLLLTPSITTLFWITSCLLELGIPHEHVHSFDEHIKNISRASFFHLREFAKIRNDVEKVIHAFVTS